MDKQALSTLLQDLADTLEKEVPLRTGKLRRPSYIDRLITRAQKASQKVLSKARS